MFLVVAGIHLAACSGCASPTREYYLKKGDSLVAGGDCESALAEFKHALQAGKPDHWIYQRIADVQVRLGRTSEAIGSLLDAARLIEKDGEETSRRARDTADESERKTLLHLLEDRIVPYQSQVYLKVALLYISSGDHAKAVTALEQALNWVESNLRARFELARLMDRKGDRRGAFEQWRRVLKDFEKASKEDLALYAIGDDELALARKRFEELALTRAGGQEGQEGTR